MFTGLVSNIGEVASFDGDKLTIKAKIDCKIGDSIAINGVCLTVVVVSNNGFVVDVSNETKKTIAKNSFKGEVHIEQAMKLNDRLDGHIVQGHIDCVGIVKHIIKQPKQTRLKIALDKEFLKFVINKGSIAIDGISLTISYIDENSSSFELVIVPHTWANTIFSTYKIGDEVNIETDMFARYIYNLFKKTDKNALNWDKVDKIMATY